MFTELKIIDISRTGKEIAQWLIDECSLGEFINRTLVDLGIFSITLHVKESEVRDLEDTLLRKQIPCTCYALKNGNAGIRISASTNGNWNVPVSQSTLEKAKKLF